MEAVIAAVISAIVALLGAIVSYFANRRTVQAELRKAELELTRRLTEKLYDKRLETYPLAFEITDGLRGEYLFKPEITHEYLADIRQQLLDWHKTQSIGLSGEGIRTYRQLREVLAKVTQLDVVLSEENLRSVWKAKNEFRRSMRKDLNLLYTEERQNSKAN